MIPLLPRRTAAVFAVASAVVVGLLIATALMRWQPPLIALVGMGLPLLFVAYANEIRGTLSVGVPALAGGLSVALGVAWAIGTDAAAARENGDALGIAPSTVTVVVTALAVSVGFAVCLLAPVLALRLLRPGPRTPLNGLVIGLLAAAGFVASSTLTRLIPSFVAGIGDDSARSAVNLAVAALVQGVAIPVTAAAVAGAVGASLWIVSNPPPRWYAASSPVASLAFALIAFLGLGVLEIVAPPFGVEMTVYALLAVLAVIVLRRVLGTTAPTVDRPQPASGKRINRLAIAMTVTVVALTAGSVGLATALTPAPAQYVCPPDCGRPPIAQPVSTNPLFTSETGEFSVSYPGEGTAYEATFEPNGVVLELLAGEGGVLRLFGQPAEGRSARDIAKQLIADHYQDATFAYELPNAMVGYQLGYGEVDDVFPADSVGDDSRARVLVMVAVKNDYALVAAGAGPFREFSPDFGSGHPSGANFLLALDMGKYVNSFQWRGDPPR